MKAYFKVTAKGGTLKLKKTSEDGKVSGIKFTITGPNSYKKTVSTNSKDGNIFNLMGIASQTLKRSGLKSEASEMCNRIMSSGSYDEALCIIGEYVNITGPADEFENEYDDEDEGMEMSL